MLLYFPHMHPEWLTEAGVSSLPEGTCFLDPGLARPGVATPGAVRLFLPPDAPFDRSKARALLADTLRFGQTVSSPRDLLAQSAINQADEQVKALTPETSSLILAEVERCVSGQVQTPVEGLDPLLLARQRAQMMLLLAWSQEEGLMELRGIGQKLNDSWARLGESVALGDAVVDDDETDQEAMALGRTLSGMTPPDALPEALAWRKLLECYAVLAPGAVLCTREAGIAADLAEAGLEAGKGGVDGLGEDVQVFRAPAWKLLGNDRLPEAKPWLAGQVILAVLPSSQQ